MALRLVLAIVLVASSAHAGKESADASFSAWVRSRAGQMGAGIERWGVVQLDDDPALERFAVVCTSEGETATVLVEKTAARRWSFTREVDGRNPCRPTPTPTWITRPRRGLELVEGYHHGSRARTLALRRGELEVVLIRTEEMNLPRDCSEETIDFDALVRTERHCAGNQSTTGTRAPQLTAPRKAALFLLDGAGGSFRHQHGDTPRLAVAASPLGRRARIAITLSRAAAIGDAVELWSIAASGEPMAWVATWRGAAWTLAGQGQAPRELPEITGDATHVAVPVMRRDLDEPSTGTPLCVSWRSASRSEAVATCELDPRDGGSFGRLYAPRREDLDALRSEPR